MPEKTYRTREEIYQIAKGLKEDLYYAYGVPGWKGLSTPHRDPLVQVDVDDVMPMQWALAVEKGLDSFTAALLSDYYLPKRKDAPGSKVSSRPTARRRGKAQSPKQG